VAAVDAVGALSELLELSSQLKAVVVADHDGAVEAATVPDVAARAVAERASELFGRAGRIAHDHGREAVAQVEVATEGACLFLVADERRLVAATTPPNPTAGLVFYDLKSLLRKLGGDNGSDA
jgi:predicted regulator of Ras-like GTPase activity (Roadblock/LC7/MglB family)